MAKAAEVGQLPRHLRVWLVLAALASLLVSGRSVGATTTTSVTVTDRQAPVPATVVLPRGYASRSWPVVYWLNVDYDGCTPSDCGPILRQLADEPFISVLPLPIAGLADYVDWHDGSHRNESAYVDLVHYVDAHYRTIPRRQYRTITGISAGGYGAALLAGDHPDLFGALASFSGILDITDKGVAMQTVFIPTSQAPPPNVPTPTGVWGAPVVHDVFWHADNPRDLLTNLRNTRIFQSAANGVPCPSEVRSPGSPLETIVRDTSDAFAREARRLGVRAASLRLRCGMHDYGTFQREIAWWLGHVPTFGFGDPVSFDYRAVRRSFSAYGWTFRADAHRASEWLTASRVTTRGFRLVGSGPVRVESPAVFAPYAVVRVTENHTTRRLVADGAGRLALTVDLGPPHRFEQYPAGAARSRCARGLLADRGCSLQLTRP